MARIGFVPSKTSVQVREPDGDAGTIPAATQASAGVMTADHVRMLEEVYQWHKSLSGGSAPVIIQEPPHVDTSQFVTRSDLQSVLQRLNSVRQSLPDIRVANDLTPRLAELERQVMLLPALAPEKLSSSIMERMNHFEHRLVEFETALVNVAENVGEIDTILGELNRVLSIADAEPLLISREEQ